MSHKPHRSADYPTKRCRPLSQVHLSRTAPYSDSRSHRDSIHVESGLFRQSLKFTERTNVSWKFVVERVLVSGKPDKYDNLVVIA